MIGFGSSWRPGRYAAVLAAFALGGGLMPAAAAAAPAKQQPTATPALSELYGVSCTSASSCIAVGDKVTGISTLGVLAERWNGTSWTVLGNPTPAGSSASHLSGVSCTSASACTAVGFGLSSAGIYQPLAESWNGTSWTTQSLPLPSGARTTLLNAVSCTSATNCTAVGYADVGSDQLPLVEAWNGTSWTIQDIPTPSDSIYNALSGVSCTSASACTATGWYHTDDFIYETLAERWDGTSWTIQDTPNPAGATASNLTAVSCSSATACTATGSWETTPNHYLPLAEVWNGTSWTIQSTPSPAGATASYLEGVSCASASVCSAVGYALNPSYTALAESINGTSWALRPPAAP